MRQLLKALTLPLALATPLARANATAYTYTSYDSPGAVEAPGNGTLFVGVNNLGQVVGNVLLTPSPIYGPETFTGFVLDQASGAYTLYPGSNGGYGLSLAGINDSGVLTGFLSASGAFVLDPATGIINRNFSPSSSVFGINDAGQVVGSAYTFINHIPSYAGFIYDPHAGYTNVNDPVAVSIYSRETFPNAINNRGQVVGSFGSYFTGTTAFLFDTSTGIYTTLSGSGATGINDVGQVVGGSYVLDLATNTYTALMFPGASSTLPQGINNAGEIVGYYTDSIGADHGFIAIPDASASVPEPASMAVLGGSLLALCCVHRRRRDVKTVALSGE